MESLAEKIGIIDSVEIQLKVSKKEFVRKIQKNLESKGHYFFGIPNTDRPFYRGKIDSDSFQLKRKRRFLDSYLDIVKAKGLFHQKNNKLIINTKVIGYNLPIVIVLLTAILMYVIMFLLFINRDSTLIILFWTYYFYLDILV